MRYLPMRSASKLLFLQHGTCRDAFSARRRIELMTPMALREAHEAEREAAVVAFHRTHRGWCLALGPTIWTRAANSLVLLLDAKRCRNHGLFMLVAVAERPSDAKGAQSS